MEDKLFLLVSFTLMRRLSAENEQLLSRVAGSLAFIAALLTGTLGFVSWRLTAGETDLDTYLLLSRAASTCAVLFVAFVVVAVASVGIAMRHARHQDRRIAGLCPSCGYDLRASPERCPECGTATATAS